MRLLRLEAGLVVPPRAYRRADLASADEVALVVVTLVLLEGTLLIGLPDLARAWGRLALELARLAGTAAVAGEDRFLGLPLTVLDFPSPALDDRALALWLVGASAALPVLARLRAVAMPLRLGAGYLLLLVGTTAGYLLHAGQLGYDAEAFSRLYVRTMVLVWAVAPVFTAALALALPLAPAARVACVVTPLAYDLVLSSVRYALFAWALGTAGEVLMPVCYLALGPLLDAVVLVAVSVLFLPGSARRLARRRQGWRW